MASVGYPSRTPSQCRWGSIDDWQGEALGSATSKEEAHLTL